MSASYTSVVLSKRSPFRHQPGGRLVGPPGCKNPKWIDCILLRNLTKVATDSLSVCQSVSLSLRLSVSLFDHKCVLFVLVAICLRDRALSLSLSPSFVSDVVEFSLLNHLRFSSFCSPCFSLSLPHSLSLCLSDFTWCPGFTFTSAHVLVPVLVDGLRFPPTDKRDHLVCSLCSRAHFGRVPTACVSSPRDGAVSTGAHMQQDMDIHHMARLQVYRG